LENLSLYIESLVFASDKPLAIKDMAQTLSAYLNTEIDKAELESLLESLSERYQSDQYAYEIVKIGGGYQFMTKGAFHPVVAQHLRLESKKRLSRAALETLAIISYKQPVTKSEMESIRGVNCDYGVQKLLDMELVEIVGREEGPGKPLLYGTTDKFMDHFGINDLKDLPQLKEFETEAQSIGLKEEE